MIETAVSQFQPNLVVNMADDPNEVQDLVQRMQKVSRRILSIQVPLAATIPTHADIARSAHDLKPEVDCNPYGVMARAMRRIVKHGVYEN